MPSHKAPSCSLGKQAGRHWRGTQHRNGLRGYIIIVLIILVLIIITLYSEGNDSIDKVIVIKN